MRYLLLGVALGVLPLAGCVGKTAHMLGKPVANAPVVAVGSLLSVAAKLPSQPVMLEGTMVEKCPVSGCWLKVRDSSGVIKVDLRGANVTATDIPAGAPMTVTGVATRVGDEATLQATGLTY